jgi:hypothetical protein
MRDYGSKIKDMVKEWKYTRMGINTRVTLLKDDPKEKVKELGPAQVKFTKENGTKE